MEIGYVLCEVGTEVLCTWADHLIPGLIFFPGKIPGLIFFPGNYNT